MRLVVFDIDGTLLQSTVTDDVCFVQAFRDEFGFEVSTDWSAYSEVTDPALTAAIFRNEKGRLPSPEELERIECRFHTLLSDAFRRNPEALAPTAGAEALIDRLHRSSEFAVAIATGAWRSLADLKLARLTLPDLSVATASDQPTRVGIVQTAIDRAGERARTEFESVVSVGDGLWDLETARHMGLQFVGVAKGTIAQRLCDGGAHTVPDFSESARFFELISKENTV